MPDTEAPCWICGTHEGPFYIDSLGCPWCPDCFARTLMAER